MKKMITVTGIKYYYGAFPFKKGQKVFLVKEPENEYDKEAIRVELPGLGKVGYVANSSFSVLGECMSAGRLYDKIGDTVRAKVKFVLPNAVVCKVLKDKPGEDGPDLASETKEGFPGVLADVAPAAQTHTGLPQEQM